MAEQEGGEKAAVRSGTGRGFTVSQTDSRQSLAIRRLSGNAQRKTVEALLKEDPEMTMQEAIKRIAEKQAAGEKAITRGRD